MLSGKTSFVILLVIFAIILLTYTIMLTVIDRRRIRNEDDGTPIFSNKLTTWVKVYLALSYILIVLAILFAILIGVNVIPIGPTIKIA